MVKPKQDPSLRASFLWTTESPAVLTPALRSPLTTALHPEQVVALYVSAPSRSLADAGGSVLWKGVQHSCCACRRGNSVWRRKDQKGKEQTIQRREDLT